jgi:epoxide hydrolase
MNAALSQPESPILPTRLEVPGAAWARLRLSLGPALASGEAWEASVAYGVPYDTLEGLADYWYESFELPSNVLELPLFETQLGAETLRFVHARAERPEAVPLLLLHGYGQSFAELSLVIEPLRAAGLHVVCPQLPGKNAAEMCATLMRRLGYERYAVHGSDLGASVALELAAIASAQVAALHVTQLPAYPPEDAALTSAEKSQLARLSELREELTYRLPETPLQALGFTLARCDDEPSRDALLSSLTLAWLYSDGESTPSALLAAAAPSSVPVVVHDFPLGTPSLARFARLSHRVVQWHEHEHGGGAPALERPAWLVDSLTTWCCALR